MKKMRKGSETKVIMRSQINLNPCNPKLHTEDDIKRQKKNIKKVGLLGGITWNETTGNLIDGHKRIMSCDLIQGYDGTPETDYELKVEAVDFDTKTEREQLLFMANSQDKIDYNMVASNFGPEDIDFKSAGFSDREIEQIGMLRDDLERELDSGGIDDFANDFLSEPQSPMTELPNIEKTSDEIVTEHASKPKMTREGVREQKQYCRNVAMKRQEDIDNFIFIRFDNLEQKQFFCDMLHKVAENSMTITGDELLSLL